MRIDFFLYIAKYSSVYVTEQMSGDILLFKQLLYYQYIQISPNVVGCMFFFSKPECDIRTVRQNFVMLFNVFLHW